MPGIREMIFLVNGMVTAETFVLNSLNVMPGKWCMSGIWKL